MSHLLTLFDIAPDSVHELFELATELKTSWAAGQREPRCSGRTLGLLFQKPSLRTRVSFEAAMNHLGGASIYLSDDSGWGTRETIEDFSSVLTRYVDVVVYRGHDDEVLARFAAAASCPVINGLTAKAHPCQALSDLFSIHERGVDLSRQKLAFVGDGNNVARSLAVGCAMLGLEFVLAAPTDHHLGSDLLRQLALQYPHASVRCTNRLEEAVSGATAVYTDVWTSMGEREAAELRRQRFAPFQVNKSILKLADDQAVFMHCLPARRGEEVTDDVIDGPRSIVMTQAENRMHLQKAILVKLLGGQA